MWEESVKRKNTFFGENYRKSFDLWFRNGVVAVATKQFV